MCLIDVEPGTTVLDIFLEKVGQGELDAIDVSILNLALRIRFLLHLRFHVLVENIFRLVLIFSF